MPVYIKIKKTTLVIILSLIVVLLLGFILGILVSRKQSRQLPQEEVQEAEMSSSPTKSSPKKTSSPRPSPSPQAPSLPAEILGGWTVYHDCPNATLNFYSQGKVKIFACDGDYQTMADEMGKYTYDGKQTIKVTYSKGDFATLKIVKEGGKTYLQLEGYETRYWKYQ